MDDLRKAEKKIKDLGKIISEKDKIINRLHIYSRGRKLPTLKPKEFSSTPSNLDGVGIEEEDVVERLDKKLKDLEMKRMKVLLEKVESPPDALGPDIGHSSGTDVSSSVRHLSSNNKGQRSPCGIFIFTIHSHIHMSRLRIFRLGLRLSDLSESDRNFFLFLTADGNSSNFFGIVPY